MSVARPIAIDSWTPNDARKWPVAEGVAHESLKGHPAVGNATLRAGRKARLSTPMADLRRRPDGPRDRQLLMGAGFCALAERDGWSFGFDTGSQYCGWIESSSLESDQEMTHWVSNPASHLYSEPNLKSPERTQLSFGAQLRCEEQEGDFLRTAAGFVPVQHVRKIGEFLADPVAVARGFMGVPYLWGGNSHAGIDCSGLVQAALHACGIACPGDSDQQQAMTGQDISLSRKHDETQPGDLIFWKGHVGMIADKGRLLHANAHHMAVAEEDLWGAIDRIAEGGDPVLRVMRPDVG